MLYQILCCIHSTIDYEYTDVTTIINDLTITALVHRQHSLSIQSSEAVHELKLLHTWEQAVNWEMKKYVRYMASLIKNFIADPNYFGNSVIV